MTSDYVTNLEYSSPILKMAAQIYQGGNVVTHQTSGETYTKADQSQVMQLPEPYNTKTHENILTGQYVDKVYRRFINSTEGKEYVRHLANHGNGRRNPGSIEDIFVVNEGEGLVAATMPERTRRNIILNADFLDTYVRTMSKRTGLPYDAVLEAVIVHELNHYDGQTKSDRAKSEPEVEFHNDFSLIKFYVDLANKYKKDDKSRELFLAKASVFASRYDGEARGKMDNYIKNKAPKLPKRTALENYLASHLIKDEDIWNQYLRK